MSEQLHIRPIAPADNKAIAQIIRSTLEEFKANKPGTVYYDPTTDDLYNLFQTPKAYYWVAELNNNIVGGAGIYPTKNLPEGYCELVKLYLVKAARGKGFGRMLMQKCITVAKENDYTNMYLETMPELQMAVSLYEQYGFALLQKAMGNSGHCGCSIWMHKQL